MVKIFISGLLLLSFVGVAMAAPPGAGGRPAGSGTGAAGIGFGSGGSLRPPSNITLPACVETRTCTAADFSGFVPPTPPAGGFTPPAGGFTPPAGITIPPCVATRTCTPADFANLIPTPPGG